MTPHSMTAELEIEDDGGRDDDRRDAELGALRQGRPVRQVLARMLK